MPNKQSIPILSNIQQVALVQSLPISQRVIYGLASTLALWLAFIFAGLMALGLAVAAVSLLISEIQSRNDVVILAIPVLSALVALVGFSSHPVPSQIKPDDTFNRIVRQAACTGLVRGSIGGFVFGFLWTLLIQISNIYVELNTILDGNIRVDLMVLYGVVIALVMAPTFALLRAFTSVSSQIILYRIAKDAVLRQAA